VFRKRPGNRFAEMVRSTVVLHLDSGQSIAGVMLAEYEDVYALARARLLSPNAGNLVPLDGEVLVEKRRVLFAQAGVRLSDTPALETVVPAVERD
jgi:hypothetical protein